MAIEEEYLDVLQNIEFAIVATYRKYPGMTDYEVMRVLEAAADSYRAEMRGHTPPDVSPSEMEADLYEAVHSMCEWRLGRGGTDDAADKRGPAPRPIRTDEIILCLKKILKSVNRWNRSGGRTGYLDFIVQYVR